ncbi:hypothetical protein PMAYCL1PPCAC_01827, partial [Pristionchus mayeri]
LLFSRFLLPTLVIFGCVRSSEANEETEKQDDCNEKETFEISEIGSFFKFSGQATCNEYKKVYQFNPDPNAKRGRMFKVGQYSGKSYMNFDIYEFTTSSNTGILIIFTKDGYDYDYDYDFSFTGTIAETPLHHHCPFPFIDLLPYTLVALEDTVVRYRCDGLITAPENYEIRIDHIIDSDASHNTIIKVYDDDMKEIQRFDSFPVEETMTGTGRVMIDVFKKSDYSHQLKIQI